MKRFLLLFCLGLLTNAVLLAQTKDRPWSIGPDLNVVEYAGDHGNFFYKFNNGVALGGSLYRYLNPSFDLGFSGFKDNMNIADPLSKWPGEGFNFDVDILSFKLAAKYKFNNGYILKEDARLQPFLKAGLGMFITSSSGKGTWGQITDFKEYSPTASFGPGVGIPIFKFMTLELASIVNFPSNADFWDLVSNENPAYPLKNSLGDIFLQNTVSLHFSIGKKAKDSDGDGINDKKDKCPDTPPGVAVDENGCPLDSDGDGVADYLDECPNVAGLAKFKGCPDSDGDGVADKDDECPDVAGLVSLNGCPDSDGDGVADKDDRCPNTPAGWKVDKFGCPIDRDRDGIPDSEDDCPDVPGVSELKGCPWDAPALMAKYNLNNKAILFDFDSSVLKDAGIGTLNTIFQALQDHADFGVEFDGHTDATGPDPYNMKLSERRADSAKKYLIGKGISGTRIRTAAFGESKPIQDNSTKEGRKYNRRVEFNFYNLK